MDEDQLRIEELHRRWLLMEKTLLHVLKAAYPLNSRVHFVSGSYRGEGTVVGIELDQRKKEPVVTVSATGRPGRSGYTIRINPLSETLVRVPEPTAEVAHVD